MPCRSIGQMTPVIPRIIRILNTLEPITLPMAIEERPFIAATTLVASSGSDVPPATMVRPIMASLTPSDLATAEADSTKRLLPTIRQASPNSTRNAAFKGFIFLMTVSSSFSPVLARRKVYAINSRKAMKSNTASRREISLSRLITASISEAPTAQGMSFFTVFLAMVIGATIAATPTISIVLKIFEPTTFPTAMSVVPFRADTKLTKNSGADVPIATTVRPITICGTFSRWAIAVAPSVRRSAPHNTSTIPIIINSIFISGAKLQKKPECSHTRD